MSKSELTRKTQWVKDRRVRNDYLDDLMDAGMIVSGPASEHGGRIWLWATKWLPKERVKDLRDRVYDSMVKEAEKQKQYVTNVYIKKE